jgi:hypothetical protein
MTAREKNSPSMLEKFMEKGILLLNREDTRKRLQLYLIDPLLNHVMERVFPYIVLTCALFALLLIVTMLTFVMLILQNRPSALLGTTVFPPPF